MTEVTLLHFDDCPSWQTTDAHLQALAVEFGFTLRYQKIETPDDAEQWQFRGSPTVLVDGHDVFATGDEPIGLSCRLYRTPEGPAGSPTLEQIRDVLAGHER